MCCFPTLTLEISKKNVEKESILSNVKFYLIIFLLQVFMVVEEVQHSTNKDGTK